MNAVTLPVTKPVDDIGAARALSPSLDEESRDWIRDLRSDGSSYRRGDRATPRAAGPGCALEVARRRPTLPHLRGDELDDIALEAADDALMSVLRRLDDFRGASGFRPGSTSSGLLEGAVKLRKRAWQGREVPLEPETWGPPSRAPGSSRKQRPSSTSSSATLQRAIGEHADAAPAHASFSHWPSNGVPIDVLADRLETTRGALYKTLHDARRKLRRHLDERGFGSGTL